jgi:hypothetical protein
MTTAYARGKKAYGFCDRCSFRYPLDDLKYERVNGVRSGLRVCPTCIDPDHPQRFLGRFPVNDPQALKDPRPDKELQASRSLWSWNPVGNQPATSLVRGRTGIVTVSTS